MSGVNRVLLVGRVVRIPEIKQTPSGQKVANFSIATSEKYKDKNTGELVEKSEFHNIVIWGKLCDVVESYVSKGMLLYLEGKLTTRSWEDNNGGGKKYRTEVLVSQLQMLSSKKDQQGQSQGGQQQGYQQQGQAQQSQAPEMPEDDLPF